VHDDAGKAVTPLPPPLELFLPPQPAAAIASAPTNKASKPSDAYLLKMDTSVTRSVGFPCKVGSIELFEPLFQPPSPANGPKAGAHR
jgi:hypothetical protein